MKKARAILKSIILLCVLTASVAGYFYCRSAARPSAVKLRQEFDRDWLSASEHELVNAFAARIKQNANDSAAVVLANPFAFRGIFDKTVQHALWLRYKGETDSSAAQLTLAAAIAAIYEKHLADKFLRREFEFCQALQSQRLQDKLYIDWFHTQGDTNTNKLEAAKYYEKSLQLSRKIGDHKREIDNLTKMQYILFEQERYDEALQMGNDLRDRIQRLGYRYRELWMLYNMGEIFHVRDEYDKAITNFEAALQITRQMGYRYGEMSMLERLVDPNRRKGYLGKALIFAQQAFQICREEKNQSMEIKLSIGRGLVYKNLGDYTKANDDFENALRLARGLQHPHEEAIALLNLGELSRILERYDIALDSVFRALEIYTTKIQDRYRMATTTKIIGDILYQTPGMKPDTALGYYGKALQITQNVGETVEYRRLEAEIELSIGDIYGKKRTGQAQLSYYQRALDIFNQIEFKEGIIHALTRVGNVLREKRDYEKAIIKFNNAINIAKQLQDSTKSQDPLILAYGYFGRGLAYKDWVKLALAEQDFARAIDIVETTRAKNAGEEGINYFATAQNLYDEMILLQWQLKKYSSAFDFSERSRARAFLDLFKNTAGYEEPPAKLAEIQRSLEANTQLIEYKVTENKLLIFFVDRERWATNETLIARDSLFKVISEFRKTLGVEKNSVYNNAQPNDAREAFRQSVALAKQLYQIVLKPIESQIDSNKVTYIVPDESIYYLPFAALIAPDDRQEKFFVQKMTPAYTPSAAILKYCLEHRKPSLSPTDFKLLAIGNTRQNSKNNLPASAQEVRNVARLFTHVDTLLGAVATEQRVLTDLKRGCHLLHFAVHAYINEKKPLSSYLVLGSNAELMPDSASAFIRAVDPNDNLLMAEEIFDLDLSQTRLATLSACKTAGGQLFRGEGIVGMTRAFMKAGAPSVLTTLWDINDDDTEKIMTSFYTFWKNEDISKAQALAKAQRQIITVMRRDKYPYPSAWAAFTLTGDYL